MIRSLRTRLFLGTTLVSALVLGILAVAINLAVRRTLTSEFDRVLMEKARSLASVVEQEHGAVHFEYQQAQFPEFADDSRTAYFEIFLDGIPFTHSQSLKNDHLAIPTTVGTALAATLPTGSPGRLFLLSFKPYVDIEGSHRASAAPHLPDGLVVVAQDTAGLEHTLASVRLYTYSICGIATLLSGTALVLVANRAIKPVRLLTARIEQFHEADLAASFDPGTLPTELAPIADRLNGLLRRLDQAFTRERTFSADVAHELRTPLSGIRATLEVCRARPRESQAYEIAIDKCLAMLTQMQSLIESLLLLARADSGQLPVHSTPIDTLELIHECWESFETRAAARGLALACNAAELPPALADRDLFCLLLNNLFDNAISYSQPSPEAPDQSANTIEVHLATTATHLTIEVINRGHSLLPQDLPHLFERFWRKDTSRSATGIHAGLGLSLCYRLAILQSAQLTLRLDADLFIAQLELPLAANIEAPIPV